MNSLPDFVSKLPIALQYFLAGIVLLASLTQLFGIQKPLWELVMLRWIWPGREGWCADCPLDNTDRLDPRLAWNKKLGSRWCQMREMRAGDYFRLNLGKPRVISEAKLECDGHYPTKYRLSVRGSHEEEFRVVGERDGSNGFIFEKPEKVRELKWEIMSPSIEPKGKVGSPSWCIYDIHLKEVYFFGKWVKRVIK